MKMDQEWKVTVPKLSNTLIEILSSDLRSTLHARKTKSLKMLEKDRVAHGQATSLPKGIWTPQLITHLLA